MKGRLHDDGTARTHDIERPTQASGPPGRIDNNIETFGARNRVVRKPDRQPQRRRDRQLRCVPPENGDIRYGRFEHLRNEQAHPPIPDDGNTSVRLNYDLFEDTTCCGDRLHERRLLVGHGGGDLVQIARRQREKLGECARALPDADDGAGIAMLFDARGAPVTTAAPDVDLSGDTLSDPMCVVRRRVFHYADELVTGNSMEPGIAFEQLQIRSTDAGQADANHALTVTLWPRD